MEVLFCFPLVLFYVVLSSSGSVVGLSRWTQVLDVSLKVLLFKV